MTNLSTPIWFLRTDAENFRTSADKISDTEGKTTFLDRANQCELAVKILELYAQQSPS